eukprot:6478578-Karenia_brevis.AAC.1
MWQGLIGSGLHDTFLVSVVVHIDGRVISFSAASLKVPTVVFTMGLAKRPLMCVISFNAVTQRAKRRA